MDEKDAESTPGHAPEGHHHLTARQRQRRGPMWGCLRMLFLIIGGVLLLLLVVIGGGWWYLGTSSFASFIKGKIEATLEKHLGRDVTIGRITLVQSRPMRVILDDVTIANAPGGVARHFATVRQVEIVGGVESFWHRDVRIERVDIRDPHLWFEVFPDGEHNFPKWQSGPKSGREIAHVEIGKLYVTGGQFSFLDRKHDIEAVSTQIASTITVTRAQDLYEGIVTSPLVRVRLQDYEKIDLDLRGGFRFTPGVLALRSIALKGRGIEAFLAGQVAPLSEGKYDLQVSSRIELPRIREIFRVEVPLEGTVALDSRLSGTQGEFRLDGGWIASKLVADAYELTKLKGRLDVTGEKVVVDIDEGRYGGGGIKAHYVLSELAEPYPMTVDLRYDGISLEQLFADWDIQNTGLRAAATGSLQYRWNKELILEGAGEGTARLSRSAVAFSQAKYPVPLAGDAKFALDKGVVTFRSAELDTESSHVSLTGSLKIEGAVTDLAMKIDSRDLSELDRIAYNFAQSADKKDFELLGFGGAGVITGTVKGPIDKPLVAAHVDGTAVQYNNVLLGDAAIDLRYDGPKGTLTFDRGVFTLDGGRLALNGSIAFPDNGEPRFDIAVDATGYPAQRAMDAVGLDLQIGPGLATGKLVVTGTPDEGRVTFAGLTVRRGAAELRLAGDVNWYPQEGNVAFDLEIAARDFPVNDIISFLDLGEFPVTGDLTGDLRLRGRKEALEGEGTVAVRNGSAFGEPIELASADIRFEQGRMRATNLLVRAAAGEITGEAELDLNSERFSYNIKSASLDLSKVGLLSKVRDLLGGKVTFSSTGAGTFDDPELVVEATLNEATISGLSLPADAAPPSLYVAIRDGRLIVRGAVADIATIEGEGSVGENLAVDGLVRITVSDVARLIALAPQTATIPAKGNLVIDLELGGRLSSLEELVVEASVPTLNVTVAEHPLTAVDPLRFSLRNGRLQFEQMALQSTDSNFTLAGFVDLSGSQALDVSINGRIEAVLLQLFVPDLRAEGKFDVTIAARGTLTNPSITGEASIVGAEFRFAGFPQTIADVNGRLVFTGNRINIEGVRATLGGGRVVLGGFITVNGLMPDRVRITVQGTEVAVRYYEGLTVEGNFSLLVSGGLDRVQISGDVDVTRALYFKDFDLAQSILNVVLSRRGVTPVTSASWQDRVDLRLRVAAPNTIAVRNNLADVTGAAEFEVAGTLANPVILGQLTLNEGGTIRFQNVDYRVVRGTIEFQNPFRIDPYFDITVEGRVSGGISEVESGPIDLTVNITGTLDRIQPTITSDPPASDITLFSILGLGGLTGRNGPSASASAVGQSLLYQSLGSLIGSQLLPFAESFSYDPGLLETGSGAGPKVSFAQRVSNEVRVLVVYNLDTHQSREVVEWAVSRDWTLQLTRDEDDEYRIDARFRRRYDGRWSFGRGRDQGELASFATLKRDGTATNADANATAADAVTAPELPPPPPTTAVATDAASDAPINEINFRADALFDISTLGQYVTLKPGQPVTTRELQSSIKNLFATGNFRDIRADASPAGSGVDVTFSLYLVYRVATVRFEGMPKGTRADRDVRVRIGDVLSLNGVEDSAVAAQEALRRAGWLAATVDPETTFDRDRSLADVLFHVTAGERANVATVLIEGNPAPFTAEQLIKEMRRGPGSTFQLEDARRDADRIKDHLLRNEHRRADVDFLGYTYDAPTNGVTLRYNVEVGPKVRVEVTGVDRGDVRRLLPFRRREAEYSEDAIDRAADRILTYYQERGYYNASVDTEGRLDQDTWVVTFNVTPGQRYRLTGVEFAGNLKLRDKQLAKVVQTGPTGGIRRLLASVLRRPTGITRAQLSDDRDALESYYRLQGFSQATVETPVVDARPDGTMIVRFPLVEGPQTIVTALTVEGNEQIEGGDLPRLQLEEGKPLNPQTLREDQVRLQTFYADRGNAEVQVTPRVVESADKTSATVTFTIAEGPKIEVDEVIVRGNTYTDQDVILRQAQIESGDPFSYTSILEAQRNLYRLGIFNRVDIQPEQTGTSVGDRDIVIAVEEGKNLTVSGSVGATLYRDEGPDDFAPRVTAAIAHRNLFGSGRYLGLETVYSSKERELFLTYREPFIGKWDVPIQVTLYQSADNTRVGTNIEQRGVSVEATKVSRYRTRWSLRYDYKISDCIEGDICDLIDSGTPVEGLDPSLLNIQISSVTPTFFWDKRDDVLDPHRGFFTSASIEYAFPFLASDTKFLKGFVQGAWYLPITERSTLAFSMRAGLIKPLAQNEDGYLPIPLSERFTAGGETSHRGFELDLLGSLCLDERDFSPGPAGFSECYPTLYRHQDEITGEYSGPVLPLGGNGLFLFNAEYRFPIAGTFGGTVFADIGNVYANTEINFDKLRYGVGAGVRYTSPVGPLRFDIGWPLQRRVIAVDPVTGDPKEYEQSFTYFLTIGYAF